MSQPEAPEPNGTDHAPYWYFLAVCATLFPLFVNGGPLYYFDTGSYIAQGLGALKTLGLEMPKLGDGSGRGGVALGEDGAVSGSRAVVYSVMIGLSRLLTGVTALAVFQGLAFVAAMALTVRAALRGTGAGMEASARRTAIAIFAAALGTMPFVAVYLMPDIFAPIMILCLGALAAFAPSMRIWEILAALALAILAVVTHPSHLFIALLMIPLSALITLLLGQRRWWLAPCMVSLVAVAGLAERVVFTAAVKTVKQDTEVVYFPFLTVRAIADGPGLEYLAAHCPEDGLATCRLYEELQVSDDPYRLTASHIMFENSRRLGSFQFLSSEEQSAVAREQVLFFLKVALERPFGMGWALTRNTLDQINRHDLSLIVPTRKVLEQARKMSIYVPENFERAWLLDNREWIGPLTIFQRIIYGLAALTIVALLVLTPPERRAPVPVRALVLMLLAGVFVNAFVCGGISQPSDRYGARVIFLVTVAAAFLVMFRQGGKPASQSV